MIIPSMLTDSIRAHSLRFERPLAPTYGDAAGLRILAAFLVVAIAVPFALRFALDAGGVRGAPGATLGFVLAWLAAFVVLQRYFVRVPMSAVGLRPWVDWTRRERLYFAQVVPLAAVVFAVLFRAHLHALIERHGLGGFLLVSLLGGLAWGMTQELVYRGWLQTELTRRFGAAAGIFAANLAFTFGPLHFDHLAAAGGVHWVTIAAIFGIGLLFGIIYSRSGNVWIPAAMHGLWPLNMG
jgi:membrane protease YdiL (CAAX protease family)